MEFNQKLIDKIDQVIAQEQQPANRAKPLTLGLMKAKEIIVEYSSNQSGVVYEYTKDGSIWREVRQNENLQAVVNLGWWVRRKKQK